MVIVFQAVNRLDGKPVPVTMPTKAQRLWKIENSDIALAIIMLKVHKFHSHSIAPLRSLHQLTMLKALCVLFSSELNRAQ